MSRYDRYEQFISNNAFRNIPKISIRKRNTDVIIQFQEGVTRFDKLSLQYYGTTDDYALILLANPEKTLEFDFEDGDLIRIPLPFNDVVQEINTKIRQYNSNVQ